MLLLDRSESTEVVYTIQDGVSPFYYKEWLNEKGKVIDCLLRDKDGFEIDDSELLERVQEFIDGLEEGA
jgi:hypothetical protein